MPAVGAVDAEHIGGGGIGRAQMLDDLAAARFIEQEYTQMPEVQVRCDQVADIAGCELLHPLVGHRDRHGKINARAGRQHPSGSLLCQRFVEFRQAVEDFILRRAGIKGNGVVVPERLRSRSKLPGVPVE